MALSLLPKKMGPEYTQGNQNGKGIKNDDRAFDLFHTLHIPQDRGQNTQADNHKIKDVEPNLYALGLVIAKIDNEQKNPQNAAVQSQLKKDLGKVPVKKC